MNPDFPSIDGLGHQVRSLAGAEGPSDVFRLLLEGARLAAPRAAIFLVRKGQIKGWGSVGYSPQAAQRQRSFGSAADAGWLGRLASGTGVDPEERRGGSDPEFGQVTPAAAAAVPLRVKGRTIALLLAERSDGEGPWFPSALGLLVDVAQLRLDLDLVRRKLRSAAEVAPGSTAIPGPAGVESKELAPVAEARPSDAPELEAVRRFAKLVATDIRLYNEEAVLLGRRDRDLARRLAEQLARGKETFLRRYGSLGPAGLEVLHWAFVQVLAGGEEALLPASSYATPTVVDSD